MKQRLLFIISDFYYSNNANSICVENILNELKVTYEVDIITNENINGKMLNDKEVTLYRGLGLSISEKAIVDRIAHLGRDSSIKKYFLFVVKCLLGIFKLTIWPEIGILSVPAMTKRALQLIKKNEYIAMISFAGNVDSHIVALKVKRLRAVKWIAVSFDPLPNENYIFKNRALFNFKIRRIEKQLFIHADAMTFPHSLYYLYLKRAEYVTKKLYLLDFPLYKDIENNISRRKLGTNDSVELLYMGSLNKKVRDIEYLFELFSDFYDKPVTLSVIGDSVLQNRIDMAIKNYGYLPHEEAIGIARQENYIGINIGNNNHYSVPSKIFDYISLKLPIISIEVFRNVPTDYYLEKYGNYIKIWQGDSIIHNLEKVRLFINNVHTNINSMKTDEVFKENSPSYIAKRIDEIMSEI